MVNNSNGLKHVLLPFGKSVYQSADGQGISNEASYLVETILKSTSKEKKEVLELGSGSGILSLMIKHYRPQWTITAMELQDHLVHIAELNRNICELDINFISGDIRRYDSNNRFELIFCNPPYFKPGSVRMSSSRERAVSRYEICCDLKDVLKAIERNLKLPGEAYLLYPDFREKELSERAEEMNLKLDNIVTVPGLKKRIIKIYRICFYD